MITVATPSSVGGVVVGYDETLGVLTQKDHFGVITPIGSGSGIGSLAQTLSIGRETGTYSIFLDVNTRVRSNVGSGSLRLDNGGFSNYVQLSSSTASTLTMDDTNIQLIGLSSSVVMNTSSINFNFGTNQFLLQNNNSYLRLGSTNVLEFTTATTVRATGNRVPAFISTSGSRFSNTVSNSVIIGGSSIIGTQSNSVYVPNLIIKDGGYVKGISGDGQLRFNSNEAYLTSGTNIIGILEANGVVMSTYNGIFITDNIDTINTTPTSANAVILSSNTTLNDSLTNTVVIGGQSLTVDSSDTVYLGGTVDINNQYKLPTSDGISGQVIKTDGVGNLSWSSGVGTPVITVTVAQFALVAPLSSSSTYRITDADIDLYGGTEIYLTTNSQGILNDVGEGRFFNPKYDQTVDGYRIWAGTSSSYATGSVVYWGGRAWSNISGVNTLPSVDIFNLASSQWTLLPYTNPSYNISYDEIKYDRFTDKIVYRNERGTNVVSTNAQNIDYWINDSGLYNPIKAFQWGNVYRTATGKGIGSQDIINSYNENINFRGIQTNVTMNNLSSQYNFNTGTSSVQDNLIFNNYSYNRESTLLGSEFNMSFQSGNTITIDGNLIVQGTTTTINSENLIVKDPIIILAASQSGTPTYDAGLFIDRGIGATQAFIWDESADEFKFITTTSGATVSGNVTIGTYSSVRTGVLSVGTGTRADSRFIVSSSAGTVSLVVDELGSVYNRGRGNISSNTAFGFMSLGNNTTGGSNTAIGNFSLTNNRTGSSNIGIGIQSLYSNINSGNNIGIGNNSLFSITNVINTLGPIISGGGGYEPGIYTGIPLMYATGSIALSYPTVTIEIDLTGVVTSVTLETRGSGFINTSTIMTVDGLYFGESGSGFQIGISTLSFGGGNNIGIGNFSLYNNITGRFNIGIGTNTLLNNTSDENTAIGYDALRQNTTGNRNTALGYQSLYTNTTGINNTAIGYDALSKNTTGQLNTAIGHSTLFNNTTGTNSVAVGYLSSYKNNTGDFNTAIGVESFRSNTSRVIALAPTFSAGSGYTPGTYEDIVLFGVGGSIYYPGNSVVDYPQVTIVVGAGGTVSSATLTWPGSVIPDETVVFTFQTGLQVYQLPIGGSGFRINIASIATAGSENTALGYQALVSNLAGSRNTALGVKAGLSIQDTTDSIYIGYSANSFLPAQINEIVIGATAMGNGSNTVTLGNDNIEKTILKGNVAIGFTGSASPNCDLEVKGNQTFTVPVTDGTTSGDVVYFGSFSGPAGEIYYYDGTTWQPASASLEATSSGLLAIALGTSIDDGMLLRGFSKFNNSLYNGMTGSVQFLSVTSGQFEEAQPSVSGEVVRVIGYCIDNTNNVLYFCPDTTWIELL